MNTFFKSNLLKSYKNKLSFLFFNILLFGCASGGRISSTAQDGYPDNWWRALPESQIAEWEIPPQAADRSKGEVVLSKRNELGQFSNLQAAKFYLDEDPYESVEGLWQSLKYPENKNDERLKDPGIKWPYTREQVTKLTGFEAKKAGDVASANMKKLGIKWVTYRGEKLDYDENDTSRHYDLILRACREKLKANPQLIELLRSTKNLNFLSDHKQKPDAPPSYKYHQIYMKLRDEFSIRD